jgi:hypothetical protein
MSQDHGEHSPDQCLHCFLQRAIEDWSAKTGRNDAEGFCTAEPETIAAGVGALCADLMAQTPCNEAAGDLYKAIMHAACCAYPVYRMAYKRARQQDEQEALLRNMPIGGKPN